MTLYFTTSEPAQHQGRGMFKPAALCVTGRVSKAKSKSTSVQPTYLEGHGGSLSWFIRGVIGVVIWLIGLINILAKTP